MRTRALFAWIAFGLFVTSCQPGSLTPRDLKKTPAVKSSNSKSECRGARKLVGGQDTSSFESVVLLMDQMGERSYQLCTGTFIGPNTLITAGHCIDPSDQLGVRYVSGTVSPNQLGVGFARGVAPSKVLHHGTSYLGRSINVSLTSVRDRDVAVLVFDQDVGPAAMELGATFPALNSIVDIVGFGSTTFAAATPNHTYRRQTGRNQISNVSAFGFEGVGIIASKTNTNVEDVLVSIGDSGGALVSQGKLVGVTSALSSPAGDQGVGLFASLTLQHNIDLLARARSLGAKIGPVVVPGTGSNSGGSGSSNGSTTNPGGSGNSNPTTGGSNGVASGNSGNNAPAAEPNKDLSQSTGSSVAVPMDVEQDADCI